MKQYPPYKTVYYENFEQYIHDIAARHGEKTAFTWYDRAGVESCATYLQLKADSLRLAQALESLGLRGKHIALAGENSYIWMVAFFAVMISGAVVVTVDIEQPDETIRAMIKEADCSAAIASPAVAEIIRPMLNCEPPLLSMLLTTEPDSFGEPDLVTLISAQETVPEPKTAYPPDEEERRRTAIIVYTSGTTSVSKPVMLTQYGILQNTSDSVTLIDSEDRIFTALPLYHTFGLNCGVLSNLIKGVNICVNGNLKTMMREMKAFKPGSMMAVPLMMETIHKMLWAGIEQAGKKRVVSRLVCLCRMAGKLGFELKIPQLHAIKAAGGLAELSSVACGGAHLSKEISEDLRAFGVIVIEGYGITECAPLISVNRNRYYKFSSAGFVVPNLELKFVDEEIWVRGNAVMNGYYKRPEENAEAFEDGWFKTGDLGYLDKKGFLHITGRKKNLIVFKNGKKISPEQIETQLMRMPIIKEVVAYGATCGDSTDDVKLAVMVYPDPEQTREMSRYEILEHLQREVDECNRILPSYQQIQMVNIREEEFSKTSSRKIRRQTV